MTMRRLAFASLLVLAACSEDAGADQDKAAAASAPPAAGQWETTTEITEVTAQDSGQPVLKVADKTTISTCVADGMRPPAPVLAGMEDCSYDSFYMSAKGRVTASMTCSKPDLAGNIMVSSEGTYKGDSFETSAAIQTALSGDGDVRAAAKVTGRRIGECAPAPTTA